MRKSVGLLVLWIAAAVLVLVAALVPDVDDFEWGQSGASAWGRILMAALLVGVLLSMVWDRRVPTLIAWTALAVAVWAGYAFNAGAWVVATLSTVLLLVLLLIASGPVIDITYREAEQRRNEPERRTQPPSLVELRAMRAEVQTMIDEGPRGGGTGDLEALRDNIDQQIREQERDERLPGR